MRSLLTRITVFGLAAVFLSPLVATGQVPLPNENHYLGYFSGGVANYEPVVLRDQFGVVNGVISSGFELLLPIEKVHNGVVSPMVDPTRHMTRYELQTPQPPRNVVIADQFGTYSVTLGNTSHMLTPALKSLDPDEWPPFPSLPVSNHYLCYEVLTPIPVNIVVDITDQFGSYSQVQLARLQWVCNPTEKTTTVGHPWAPAGTYPIVDPSAHLTVYFIPSLPNQPRYVSTLDQFSWMGQREIHGNEAKLLYVPATKEYPIRTEKTTWGRVKALYR